jgi:hypothetical protein
MGLFLVLAYWLNFLVLVYWISFFIIASLYVFMHLIYIDQNTPIAPHTNSYTFNLLLHVGGICSIREFFLRYSSKL